MNLIELALPPYNCTSGQNITAALNGAVAALAVDQATFGGVIALPQGASYLDPIVVPKAFWDESRIKIIGRNQSSFLRPTSDGPLFTVLGGKVEFSEISFDNPNQKNATAVRWLGSTQTAAPPERDGKVHRCKFTNYPTCVVNDNFDDVRLTENETISCGLFADWKNGGMGSRVTANKIWGGRGLRYMANGWASEGHIIIGNGMIGMIGGIEIFAGTAFDLIGNQIDTTIEPALLLDAVTYGTQIHNVQVVGGWLSGSGQFGLRVSGSSVTDVTVSGGTALISANNPNRVGVFLQDAFDVALSDIRASQNGIDLLVHRATRWSLRGGRLASSVSIQEADDSSSGYLLGATLHNAPYYLSTKTVHRDNRGLDIPL